MKKLIALLLSLILVFSICSISAFAEEATTETTVLLNWSGFGK